MQELEAESIHALREAAAVFRKPVILYSIGKDSSVLLHLALKAFYPAKPPFEILHVDTTWKFREMIEFRDRRLKELGLSLHVHVNPEGVARGIGPVSHGASVHTDIMKTEALKQALDQHGFDAAIRRRPPRRGTVTRQGADLLPAQRGPSLGSARPAAGAVAAVQWPSGTRRKHPRLPAVELDRAGRLDLHRARKHSGRAALLRQAAPRGEADGMLIMVDDERFPLLPREVPEMRWVRFRTLGCYPLTGAVESRADTLPAIIAELASSRTSERQGRAIDHGTGGSMERKKVEGYF